MSAIVKGFGCRPLTSDRQAWAAGVSYRMRLLLNLYMLKTRLERWWFRGSSS
jgi:hypothetical protein